MDSTSYSVVYPDSASQLDQDEEFFTIITKEGSKRLRIHEYDKVYRIPGLYEEVVHKHLRCDSPRMVSNLLAQEFHAAGEPDNDIRALDFGAGNGISGECLMDQFDCNALIGLDIFPEARIAARRDRPEIYNEYYVMNLSEPSEKEMRALDEWNFNILLTVASLGFGDIPTQGFINAFNLVEEDGWIAFNIKDRFMANDDDTGYHDTLKKMMGSSLETLKIQHYCHRLSMSGEPIHYYAVVGRKKADIFTS